MKSKFIDNIAVTQVIGCVYNNPSLLEQTDKYTITDEDFVDDFHRIVFGAIYKIHELGGKKINLKNISDFLSTRPKSQAIFNLNKGEEYINKVAEAAIMSTFDYYYSRLKKMTLLRAYDNIGLDVSFIYDPDNILDTKKKEAQEEALDNATLSQIAQQIEDKIDNIRSTYVDGCYNEAVQAADGVYELIESLKETPEVGVPLYGPLINTVTRGARLRKFYLRSAATGVGKAIPNDTLIPTPLGWRKVGDIRPGDKLFGQDGKETSVLQIHPQPSQKEVWKITFSDGRIAKCCGEHLWEYRYSTHAGYGYRIEDTQTIYNRTLKLKNGFKNGDGRGYRFHIRLNQSVQYPYKELSLPPYVMGAFLGDGSFRYDNTNKSLYFSSVDREILEYITSDLEEQKTLAKGWYFTKNNGKNYSWTFRIKNNPTHPIWVEEFLKDYPELWNLKSEDKFIPQDYLTSSQEQRMMLLKGLLDTDGSIDEKGRINFTTISPKLRDNIIELCQSLGFIVTYSVDLRQEKYTTGECYNIHIQCKKSFKPNLFRLKRKQVIAEKYANSKAREEYKDHLAIINIEKTSELTDMTCFTVDNKDHLFLMNNFIVTHNTRSMVADATYIACSKIYDEQFGWISAGAPQPTLYITTEQDKSEVQTMMLAFLSGVNEEHILNGSYELDEEERIMKAAQILSEAPLYIEEIPNFSLQDIENIIKRNIRDHGVLYVMYDYIHTSLKILEEITRRSGGVKLREDNVLFMLATRLKDIANEYGVFILSSTQLNGDWAQAETPDQNLLRGAKSIADRIDFGAILLNVKETDLKALEPILSGGVFEQPTIKISVYKNRRGRHRAIYLWCKADLGCCRIKPMFATTYNYELIQIDDLKINVEASAFEDDD